LLYSYFKMVVLTPLKSLTDPELTELIRQGDKSAFTEIYNRHWQFLYSSAYNILRNKADSMDVCQSVFLWVWENRKVMQIKTNVGGYLYTAVKYKIANLIKKGKVSEVLVESAIRASVESTEINQIEVKQLKAFIDQLIDDLPRKCREVFLLSRNEHMSHKEISIHLGISEKTVDAHITRALKKLRVPLNRLASIWLML
jgi:RNA polymerase sigma-70 factor (family 1)